MNYLLDKKARQKKVAKIFFFTVLLLILVYFSSGIFSRLSTFTHFVFRPVLIFGSNLGGRFSSIGAFFADKKSLFLENEKLKSEISSLQAQISNYESLLDENSKLKEILGRKDEKAPMLLANVLSKPNQSPYDTIVIDVGGDKAVRAGDTVFALGNIPIGRVDLVYGSSSKVVLFSSPGEKIEAVIPGQDIFIELVGRGGGNFEMSLLRDISVEKGSAVILPGINSYVLAIVEKVISDPREALQKVLLVSPVNIQELRFVQVER